MSLIKKINALIATILMNLIWMSTAFSQTVFSLSDNDVSKTEILDKLFGGLTGGGANPFGAMIGTFNTGVLMIGGILAGYSIIRAVIGTAQDGEMMGKKMSSVFFPLRMAIGAALIVPIGGGYCVIQYLVMFIVMKGIALANVMWTSFSATVLNEMTGMEPTPVRLIGEFDSMAAGLLTSHICVETYNKASYIADLSVHKPLIPPANKEVFYYGMSNIFKQALTGSGAGSSACGKATIPKTKTNIQGNNGGVDILGKPIDLEKMDANKLDAFNALNSKMAAIAKEIVEAEKLDNATSAAIAKKYTEAVKAYSEKTYSDFELIVKSEMADADKMFQKISNDANKDGWILAGAWFAKYANTMNKLMTKSSDTPTIAGPEDATNDSDFEKLAQNLTKAKNILDGVGKGDRIVVIEGGEKDDKMDTGAGFQGGVMNIIVGVDLSELSNETRHPMAVISRIGSGLVGAGLASFTAFTGICILAFASPVCVGLTPLISGLIITLLVTGFTMLYFIPMLPFIIWMGAIVGWAILVFEGVLAAPLWALMHMHPNGDDLMGRGGNGYQLVLSLALRPALMIAGLAAAMILLLPVFTLLNKVFLDVFASTYSDGSVGMFGMLVGVIIYTGIAMSLIKQMFSLIHIIPDQVLRWAGGSGDGLIGQMAGQMDNNTSQTFGSGISAVSEGIRGIGDGAAKGKESYAQQKVKGVEEAKSLSEAGQSASASRAESLQSKDASLQKGRQNAVNKEESINKKLAENEKLQKELLEKESLGVLTQSEQSQLRALQGSRKEEESGLSEKLSVAQTAAKEKQAVVNDLESEKAAIKDNIQKADAVILNPRSSEEERNVARQSKADLLAQQDKNSKALDAATASREVSIQELSKAQENSSAFNRRVDLIEGAMAKLESGELKEADATEMQKIVDENKSFIGESKMLMHEQRMAKASVSDYDSKIIENRKDIKTALDKAEGYESSGKDANDQLRTMGAFYQAPEAMANRELNAEVYNQKIDATKAREEASNATFDVKQTIAGVEVQTGESGEIIGVKNETSTMIGEYNAVYQEKSMEAKNYTAEANDIVEKANKIQQEIKEGNTTPEKFEELNQVQEALIGVKSKMNSGILADQTLLGRQGNELFNFGVTAGNDDVKRLDGQFTSLARTTSQQVESIDRTIAEIENAKDRQNKASIEQKKDSGKES